MYSIVDIETTGGKYGEEKIIEIALYKFDGEQVVDSFSTLVNPERSIDDYVQKLTGITPKMVKRAPKFHEIAKRIIDLTSDTVLVAHNAPFDYRMLRQEYKELGYNYERKTLDTINLSKHLLPNIQAYSLPKISKSLGIPHTSKHRAFGDAQATVELFKILLNKDVEKFIINKSISNKIYGKYAPKIVSMLDELPNDTGVFYLHNINGKIIYIGASQDISNNLHSIFTGKTYLSKKLQNKTDKITFEKTGSLLVAKIKSRSEINELKPPLNKFSKKERVPKVQIQYPQKDMVIYDKGRNDNEKSFFVIRDFALVGFGYFDLNSQVETEEKLLSRMTLVKEKPNIKKELWDFIEKKNISNPTSNS